MSRMLKWTKRRNSAYNLGPFKHDEPQQRLHRMQSLDTMKQRLVGERVMCVWEAVYAASTTPGQAHPSPRVTPRASPRASSARASQRPTPQAVEHVTRALAASQHITYQDLPFKLRFNECQEIHYIVYIEYFFGKACASDVPCHVLLRDIEAICWRISGPKYSSQHVHDLHPLWVVFNKLAQVGSWPPVMCYFEASWLLAQLAELLGIPSLPDISRILSYKSTFRDLLETLESHVLLNLQPDANGRAIDKLYKWLAAEVIKEGWLIKRTKKGSRKWGTWQCRWFVLTPFCALYYSNEGCAKEKGFVEMHRENALERLDDINGVIWKYKNRFSMEKKSTKFKIELCAPTAEEKEDWLDKLSLVISSRRQGTTPITELLNQRHRVVEGLAASEARQREDGDSNTPSSHSPLLLELDRKLRAYCPHFASAFTLKREKKKKAETQAEWVESWRKSNENALDLDTSGESPRPHTLSEMEEEEEGGYEEEEEDEVFEEGDAQEDDTDDVNEAAAKDVQTAGKTTKAAANDVKPAVKDFKFAVEDAKDCTSSAKNVKPAGKDVKHAGKNDKSSDKDVKFALEDVKDGKSSAKYVKPAGKDLKFAVEDVKDGKPSDKDVKPAVKDVKPAVKDVKFAVKDEQYEPNECQYGAINPMYLAQQPSTLETCNYVSMAEDEDAIEVELEKLKVLFLKIDGNGDGKLDSEEFYAFIQTLDIKMTKKETDLIFMTIDKDRDKYVNFHEFETYFVEFVLGESSNSASEAKLRAAFLAADREGSGTIRFKSFIRNAFQRRRTISIRAVTNVFQQLDKDSSGDICFREFREFFGQQKLSPSALGLPLVAEDSQQEDEDTDPEEKPEQNQKQQQTQKPSSLEGVLRELYRKSDGDEMVPYLLNRWQKFKTFRRDGKSGETVMSGAHGIVDDFLPGEYALLDLACFNDLPPITPRHTVIENIQWLSSSDPSKSGRMLFPEEFDGTIASEFATNETLAFYGCSLADGNQLKVSLLYRHGIQDFTYTNNYLDDYVLAGGRAGIERHAFSHLDCPLDPNSGRFVIAKIQDGRMCITAFKIPTRHTLYVPPETIHSNDYLKGTWRTMLSDEAHIDHVQLFRCFPDRDERIKFSFEPLDG